MTPALAALRREPARSGIFTDFDGTLSDIVADPDTAEPLADAVAVLADLAERFGKVAVLSGRPLSFIEGFFPPAVTLAGLYGLETKVDGVRHDHPLGGTWREVVDDVAAVSVARGPVGMRVEPKGISLTLHFRERADLADEVRAWAELQAARSGLVLRSARMSYELHPPIAMDKGTMLTALAADLDAVCFLGDDVGDLPAFDALDALGAAGVAVVRVGVRSPETAPELLQRADLVVDGPAGALAVLRELRDAAGPAGPPSPA